MGLLRRQGGRPRWAGRARLVALAVPLAVALAAAFVVPAGGATSGLAIRMAGSVRRFFSAPSPSRTARPFNGVAAVGALFVRNGKGQLGQHFCTASVVNSPGGDLALTAAHCVTQNPGTIVFAPGYANGRAPYGLWRVTRAYMNRAWQKSEDPDDDIAFLRLARAADGVPIEDVTGAESLATGWPARSYVRVVGYPDGAARPVWCANWTREFSPTQLRFDCGGYTTGTSGGPFLADVSAITGEGTVIGVLGGYHQGGNTPSVSYSIAFGPAVARLFAKAEAGG